MGTLQGKTVLVTGASGGIGRLVAERLALHKATVLLVGREQQALSETHARIIGNGGNAEIIVADLLAPEGRELVVNTCLSLPAGLYGLVNSAGVNHFALLEDQTDNMLQTQVNLNLVVPMLLVRSLLPALGKEQGARILNIGSTFGSIGYPGYTAYCASKFGLRGFNEALRRELSGSGIRVLYFAPRATSTRLNPDNVVAMNRELGNAMDNPESVAEVAENIFINGTPDQLFFGWPEKLFARVNQLLPGIVDNALAKQLPVIKRYAGRK